MASINDDVKAFIVRALACFDAPATVAKAVKEEFGIELTRQHCETYNPTKASGAAVGKKWVALFDETRKRFLEDTSSIGISHRSVRLKRLERMAEKAENMGAISLAAQLLEQAAKESGGTYSNKHKIEHTGPGGGPVQTMDITPDQFAVMARKVAEEV